jgi:transcriptional regulator GlxA family with amidase domain
MAAMTISIYILPMKNTRRIIFLVYDGFELLDLSGPSAVFSAANALKGQPLYEIVVISPLGGIVGSNCGVSIATRARNRVILGKQDTLLTVGAYEQPLRNAMSTRGVAETLTTASKKTERFGSVCTGAFLLASAGLLRGKSAATHWSACARLADSFSATTVDAEALYVKDGRLWTSAGVSAGIDMALAMLESDHGSAIMARVARHLVVYAKRPGHQSQFSALLEVQGKADGAFSELVAWLESKVSEPIRVSDMAEKAGMSERSFHRRFTTATGRTPSRFFEELRLERAMRLLEAGRPVKNVAATVGFRSESAFRTAFRARFGATPGQHARMHATGG